MAYAVMSGFGAMAAMTIERVSLQDSPVSFGLAYEDVSFHSRFDGVLLKGWFIPADGETAIAVVNGGYQNRIDDSGSTLGMTRALVGAGYDVLLFDLRGRGESEGTGNTLCYGEEDIGGAVDYLNSLGYQPENICIMGYCSGAALSSIYVSRNNDIGALVLDGCFARVSNMVVREADGVGVPAFFTRMFLPGLHLMSRLFYGYEMVNPVDVVDDIECPILFIYEEYDEFVNGEDAYDLYRASDNPEDEVWQVLGSKHSHGFIDRPEEYIKKVTGFLERGL